jgi:hypothetical protein
VFLVGGWRIAAIGFSADSSCRGQQSPGLKTRATADTSYQLL